MLILWPIFFHTFILSCLAVLVNVTVDDTFGDPITRRNITYQPNDQWFYGPSCAVRVCPETGSELFNRTELMNRTWHHGTTLCSENCQAPEPPSASHQFYGSAIYVYCILAPYGHTNMTFLIDSQIAGNFSGAPTTGNGTFQYNVLVYANQNLPQGNHTLTVQSGQANGLPSLVLLDYIVYTYDKDLTATITTASFTSSSLSPIVSSNGAALSSNVKNANNAGKIVGGVLGPIAIFLLALVVCLWYRQRNVGPRNARASTTSSPQPNIASRFRGASWMHGLRHSLNNRANRRFSFNPSLLVQSRTQPAPYSASNFRHPPPVTIVVPINPPPERPDSTRPLQPNRQATPTPSLDPRNEPSQPLSIQEWRRRTQREADDVAPQFDVSDVEMSSYYDFSSDTPDPPQPQPQPRPPPRRFTVVNVTES